MLSNLIMKRVVKMVARTQRSPVLRRPDEYGMEYQDISFQAADGITLEGWYMPANTPSNKVVICNHFSPGNRYGYAGHIKPWHKAGGFEVNFLPKYKALVAAGFNVLAYDLRNHGFSAPAQNGGYNPNLFEYKDVLGSLNYISSREDTRDMEIHLHSMCLGGNATLVAMRRQPDVFKDVKSMVLVQPISGASLVRRIANTMRLGKKGETAFEQQYQELWGYRVSDSSPIQDASFVSVPTLVVQVKDDTMTYPEDVQQIYDAIPSENKDLLWIEGTTQRFRGYTYFSEQPREMLEWYQRYSN